MLAQLFRVSQIRASTNKSVLSLAHGLRYSTRTALSWSQLSSPLQFYVSTSKSPYLNLAFEHFILQNSHPESKILFLYVNRPSVIIGRNQNPWLEADLHALHDCNVHLVRRRSGGGAVFHDEGNVNWSIICPSQEFTRDKHAEMVVRALRKLGIARARVNERHDIVLDQGTEGAANTLPNPQDTHRTSFTTNNQTPLKLSGSAYKLTKGRALHHGTCLLEAAQLKIIGQMLKSPARGHIFAKGVESVRSPVGKANISNRKFSMAVKTEFARLYKVPESMLEEINVGEEVLEDTRILKGVEELQSDSWRFGQTPKFELRSHPSSPGMLHHTSPLPFNWPNEAQVNLHVRHGVIQTSEITFSDFEARNDQALIISKSLINHDLVNASISCGTFLVNENKNSQNMKSAEEIGHWIDKVLPIALTLKNTN